MADLALYEAKSRGRGTYAFFEAGRGYAQRTRRRLEGDLKAALAEEQLELHYQPIVDAETGNLTSCAALLRWKHPQLGKIAPGNFIPLAEETRFILPIGKWALRQACRDAAGWPEPIGVTVNCRQCGQRVQFLQRIRSRAALSSLAPRRLELGSVIEGVGTSVQLKERGCDQVQGYSFSRPLPGSEVKDLLAQSTLQASLPACHAFSSTKAGSLPQAGLRRRGSLGSGLLLLVAVCHAFERSETRDKHGAPTL